MYELISKIYVNMDNWRETVDLQQTYSNISAVKIKFCQYTTSAAGYKALSLRCKELGDNGIIPKPDQSNTKYLIMFPIDPYAPVTCIYEGTVDYDSIYLAPRSVNQLTLEVFIDGDQAVTQVSALNPVTFELALYKKI